MEVRGKLCAELVPPQWEDCKVNIDNKTKKIPVQGNFYCSQERVEDIKPNLGRQIHMWKQSQKAFVESLCAMGRNIKTKKSCIYNMSKLWGHISILTNF